MMSVEEAIAKAQKLMRLAKSSNAHEAALAAQRAQEILARYDIDRAALDVEVNAPGPVEAIQNHGAFENGGARLASWKPMLANKIAQVNACKVYTIGSSVGIIGRASDVAKVKALYAVLAAEVDRLTATLAKGQGRSYATSFRVGCVAAIGETLRAAKDRVAAQLRDQHLHNPQALVRIDRALERIADKTRELDAWVARNMRFGTRRSSYRGNAGGYGAGYAAGKTVNVSGVGNKRLGS